MLLYSFAAEYPYINYYVIQKPRAGTQEFFRRIRQTSYDAFNPTKIGYRCDHTIDLFEEMATIARPPVEAFSKKPVAETTGYIVCVYKVFKGDDGEKFERNWLYWTGETLQTTQTD